MPKQEQSRPRYKKGLRAMVEIPDCILQALTRDGYTWARTVFEDDVLLALRDQLSAVLARQHEDEAIRTREGSVYAARNILALLPSVRAVWREPPLPEFVQRVLGTNSGLVRALFFDKPPERSWTLPWHKDLTIAVRDHVGSSVHFSKPTRKAGICHVEASTAILTRMLTLRIHLDDVDEENGPLEVAPGSHQMGKQMTNFPFAPVAIHARAGDVLLMRPLLAHASGRSREGTTRHRRILHLEFAADPLLPDGYHWHDFCPIHVP